MQHSLTQYQIDMLGMANTEGILPRVVDIADETDTYRARVVQALNSLEKKGYVKKVRRGYRVVVKNDDYRLAVYGN